MKKGSKMSMESCRKMREAAREDGRMPPSFKGKKHSEETKRKISKSEQGKVDSEETKKRRIASARSGEDNYFWKGGITPLRLLIKQNCKYRQWRSEVFTRDDFTCQVCGQRGGAINADHIKSFSLILDENNIKTVENALACEELWNINNGRTLCEECHRKTDNFGSKGRISYQKAKKRKDLFRNQKYTIGWTEAGEVPGWGNTKELMKVVISG